jgi:hypothetical protein
MNFAPEQKEEFRQLIKQTVSTIQLLESRAGLDQFDSELVNEVIRLDELNSSLQNALLHGFSQVVSTEPIPTDTILQQIVNEEYQD